MKDPTHEKPEIMSGLWHPGCLTREQRNRLDLRKLTRQVAAMAMHAAPSFWCADQAEPEAEEELICLVQLLLQAEDGLQGC